MIDFSIIRRAGLTITDAGKLFNVTRGTARAWINGGEAKNKHIHDLALDICRTLESAMGKGLLPLRGVRKNEKIGVIRRIIEAEMEWMSH